MVEVHGRLVHPFELNRRLRLRLASMTTRNRSFYLDFAVFKVENELFRIPTYYLQEKSLVFRAMFTSESPMGQERMAGGSDDNPIKLDGVSKIDFQRFLEVILRLQVEEQVDFKREYWLSVLMLANLWKFPALRAMAIKKLSPAQLTAIEKVVYGRSYYVEDWMVDGYKSMVERDEKLSEMEIEKLGWAVALKVYNLREDKLLARIAALGPCSSLSPTNNLFGSPMRTTPLPSTAEVSSVTSLFGSPRAVAPSTYKPVHCLFGPLPSSTATSTSTGDAATPIPTPKSVFAPGGSSPLKTAEDYIRAAFSDELGGIKLARLDVYTPPPRRLWRSPH